ncbi:MAG TPA: penicillin-binding transpeptidase domain-containing protein [Gaiellaceae bacterium]|jgi:peptidoglycan glycosyltransferase|nr:penicillin-binding transpeptidase domain-containing protein [Gaiellaceae bacterium]
MNRAISRLALVGTLLMVVLVVATTYWQAWAAGDLRDRQDNQIQRVAQFTVDRGEIIARNPRTVVATNEERKVGGRTLYFRRYPRGGVTAHVVGYSTQARARAGLERSRNDYLTASNQNLSTVVDRTVNDLKGATIRGNDLVLTLHMRAQQVALRALGGRCGSVVALEPSTGKVLVMASSPTYDQNVIERDFSAIERIKAPCKPVAPLYNRATYGLYAPGSTYKVVTAAAAIDSGRYKPDSRFYDPGYCEVYGRRVNNYDTTRPFGTVDLRQALRYSINSVFCNIGKALGSKAIVEYSKRFGFYNTPPLETPDNERAPSGLYAEGDLLDPKLDSDVDAGRFAFGQERLLVTPLQMAMVAGAIGNGGVVMKPFVVDRVLTPDGDVLVRTKPTELRRAVKAATASAVAAMMRTAVEGGTGTAARISGVVVAGKTGTAETGVAGTNNAWFICFAGRERPQVAVAVVLEQQNGTGGQLAAPVAREVLQALLPGTANS